MHAMGRLEGLAVVRSKIHGYGIVTQRRFTAGERICFGDGVLWEDEEEFDDTYALILHSGDVAAGESPDPRPQRDLFWDLADQTRWLNHSCDPNSVVEAKWVPSKSTVEAWWTALRDIEIGEEVTYDYAFSAAVAEPCFCGAATCRGVIVDPDEIDKLPDELRRRLTIKRAG
jgi:SET domain-containing protein